MEIFIFISTNDFTKDAISEDSIKYHYVAKSFITEEKATYSFDTKQELINHLSNLVSEELNKLSKVGSKAHTILGKDLEIVEKKSN